MIRVYISPGLHLRPQLFRKWSTSGHGWTVLDIPADLYQEVTLAIDDYSRTQALLREYLEKQKGFCTCGSDHADLPPESDY